MNTFIITYIIVDIIFQINNNIKMYKKEKEYINIIKILNQQLLEATITYEKYK